MAVMGLECQDPSAGEAEVQERFQTVQTRSDSGREGQAP
jgi:hypothetical protein